ncbi:hydrolase [Bacillus sp. 2205SS5-2]|uniref:hydrolase n=1 Tax=Bacillus sp. 2205SS5-2 TaxID=3109031 RepID=UPI003006B3DB
MSAENKRTYYIGISTGEISSSSTDSPWEFKISANDEEITYLRDLFDSNYSTDWQSFFRAHVPYIQYHYDRENDAYDQNLQQIYATIYELGDEEAREHIGKMNILP